MIPVILAVIGFAIPIFSVWNNSIGMPDSYQGYDNVRHEFEDDLMDVEVISS